MGLLRSNGPVEREIHRCREGIRIARRRPRRGRRWPRRWFGQWRRPRDHHGNRRDRWRHWQFGTRRGRRRRRGCGRSRGRRRRRGGSWGHRGRQNWRRRGLGWCRRYGRRSRRRRWLQDVRAGLGRSRSALRSPLKHHGNRGRWGQRLLHPRSVVHGNGKQSQQREVQPERNNGDAADCASAADRSPPRPRGFHHRDDSLLQIRSQRLRWA